MKLFDLLGLMNSTITPDNSKIHLATWNGQDDPIDVYLAGEFDEWQRWQTRKNFERNHVVSLITMPGSSRWLFAGVHSSNNLEWIEQHNCWYYGLNEDQLCSEMNGRMVISFERPGRQSYLNAENWFDRLILEEIFPKRLSITEFPGFKAINLTKAELDLIVRQSLPSWRAALSNVAGVYLIADTTTGKLYVGSASGEGGIWQRWESYSFNGHGGNVELRKLLNESGEDRARSFRYSVLEIADTHASREDILRREVHWKNILLSKEYGLNGN